MMVSVIIPGGLQIWIEHYVWSNFYSYLFYTFFLTVGKRMPYNHNSVKCEHFIAGKQGPKNMLKYKTNSMWQVSAESSSIFLYLNHCSSKIIWGTDSCSFFSQSLSTLIHQTLSMSRALPLSVSYTVYQSPKLQFYSLLSRISCSLKAPNRKRCTLRQPTFIHITTYCYSYFIIIYFFNLSLCLLCKLYFIKGIERIKPLQVWHYLIL